MRRQGRGWFGWFAPWLTAGWLVSAASCGWIGPLPDNLEFSGTNAWMGRGASHCDHDDTWIVTLRDGDGVSFVRTPSAIPEVDFATESRLEDVVLPLGVEQLGEATEGVALWIDPGDMSAIYVEYADGVEKWARSDRAISCE